MSGSQVLEYTHIVGYFRQNVPSSPTTCRSIAQRLEEEFGAAPTELYASALEGESPGPGWEQTEHGMWKVDAEGPSVIKLPAISANLGSRPSTVLLARSRPGAKQGSIDFMWSVLYQAEDRYPHYQFDSQITVSIRTELFTNTSPGTFGTYPAGRRQFRELVDHAVQTILQAGDCYYLLVDIAEARMTGAASVYTRDGTPIVTPGSLTHDIARTLWAELGFERRNYVRGVFWGNYLNPQLLARLGGREEFRERYLAHAKGQVRLWRELASDTPDGGLIVKLSHDPADESVPFSGGLRLGTANGAWLHKELRAVGALL